MDLLPLPEEHTRDCGTRTHGLLGYRAPPVQAFPRTSGMRFAAAARHCRPSSASQYARERPVRESVRQLAPVRYRFGKM